MTCNQIKIACQTKGSPSYRSDVDRTYLQALKNAGYWNSWVGKFVNWYPCAKIDQKQGTYRVPGGVDDWHVTRANALLYNGNFDLIESETGANAVKVRVPRVGGDADYGTYVIRDKTMSAIDRCAQQSQPCFFAWMPNAPHVPGKLPANYDATRSGHIPSHYPSFNEGCPGAVDPDISDKPSFARAHVTCYKRASKVQDRNAGQASLQAVDDSIAALFDHLRDAGLYDNTIVIFTSDHGYSFNENNRLSKEVPYDTDSRVPLFIRVPSLPGGTVPALVYLPDLAATLYDIADASPIITPDGLSLLPLMTGEESTLHPDGIFGSHRVVQVDPKLLDIQPWYALYQDCSVTPQCFVLIRYDGGEYELYDLTNDPFELQNLLPNPVTGYAGVPGWDDSNPVVADLKAQLDARIAAGV
jgi:arylsulfatase A-like enzyme